MHPSNAGAAAPDLLPFHAPCPTSDVPYKSAREAAELYNRVHSPTISNTCFVMRGLAGRYVVNDTPQPLVIVGEAGTGRTSMCQANVKALVKRFPPPDTLIISHFAG
jgi:hypothetical protein